MVYGGSWLGRAGRNWGVRTGLAALLFGAVGFVSGVQGPLVVGGVGAAVYAAPTQGGIVLVIGILAAGVTAVAAFVTAALTERTPRTLLALFVASLALVGGVLVGVAVGS